MIVLYTIVVYNRGMRKNAKQTSIRLTPEARALIKRLSDKLGINQTSVIEMAIRVLAEKENVR
jgi:predicted DNA-binding protein